MIIGMGNRKILTGAVIVGVAVMLTLSIIPADARHPSVCPRGADWSEETPAFAPPGTDRNGNGTVCFNSVAQIFIDDHVHRN